MSGEVAEKVAKSLWHSTEKRGHYTMLDDPLKARLRDLLPDHEIDEVLPELEPGKVGGPYKAPLMVFDFVEICGGAGVVSRHASAIGLVVAPVLDISESKHYDLRGLRFLEWACHMISTGRFESFLIEPPCATFSPAAHPSVRSYSNPLGYDRCEKKTLLMAILWLSGLLFC